MVEIAAYYLNPSAIGIADIAVIKTITVYSFWLGLVLSNENKIMCNNVTVYVSGISMKICLFHMLVFRVVEKIISRIWNEVSFKNGEYTAICLSVIDLLLIGLYIYKSLYQMICQKIKSRARG